MPPQKRRVNLMGTGWRRRLKSSSNYLSNKYQFFGDVLDMKVHKNTSIFSFFSHTDAKPKLFRKNIMKKV